MLSEIVRNEAYLILHSLKLNIFSHLNKLYESTLRVPFQAESMLAADETLNKEYLSMGGLQSFTDAATRLVLG